MNNYLKITAVLVCSLCSFSTAMSESRTNEKKPKLYMVSNAHLDTQWNWDVQMTISEFLKNTLTQNFALFEKYPSYVFNFEGGVKYQWIKEYYPEEYKKLQQYIKDGRWHISGSSWDANDSNVPSTESGFRNVLLAQEFYKKEFGVTSKDMFLPDCFGFSYTLPTIAHHCGILGFSTQKLQWRQKPFYGDQKVPFSIGVWQGIDGGRIMTALDGGDYTWNPSSSFVNDGHLLDKAKATPLSAVYRYYGTLSTFGQGDRGGSASVLSQKCIEGDMKKADAPFEIINATSSQLYEDYPLDKHPELPVFDGELLMDFHGVGCYTSQGAMKRFNRRNEQLADAAERSSVMADWLNVSPYPQEKINDSWKRFIWHQFHDDLTGTSIPKAYEFSWNDEIISQTEFSQIITTATDNVSKLLDTNAEGTPVVVFNPAAYVRKDMAEVNIPVKGEARFAVYSPKGKKVRSQVLAVKDGMARVIFEAEMKPLSYSVYDIREADAEETSKNLTATDKSIENKIYKVTLDERGDICSIVDKRNNKELVDKGAAFGFAILDENKIGTYPAWEIKKSSLDNKSLKVDKDVKISVEEVGVLRAALKVERKYGESAFVQRIVLTDGGADERIDIENEIDWATPNSLLKAEFPMSVGNDQALYDLGIGAVKRGINTETAYEVPAQHWASQSEEDNSYGISILNNGKYGWDKPSKNNLRLTLFHSPSSNSFGPYQNVLDFGHHKFTYSIVGHEGDALKAGIVEKAERLNQPLLTFSVPKHEGKLGKSFSFASSSTPQVAIKAVKKAEDGEGYIVRVYETEGREVKDAAITFPSEILSAEETNGIEEFKQKAKFEGNKLIVSSGKFAPGTYRVKLKENATPPVEQVESTFVSLPYNRNAISSDAFSALGHMDDAWNSYAAELMPGVIESGTVKFAMGEADVNNVVSCDNQNINLPNDKKYKQLNMLVASKNGDRDVSFVVDGKEYPAHVPYYSGYYGQWGWADYSKSYVKSGNLAYVGDHQHSAKTGNVPYIFTYLYKVTIDLPEGAKELVLPKDDNVMLFSATLTNEKTDEVKPLVEPRFLP